MTQNQTVTAGKNTVFFELLKDVNNRYFQDMLDIYVESFPENERRPNHEIVKSITEGREICYIGLKDFCVVLFALLWPINGTDFILLDYLATKKGLRRSGLAKCFLSFISQQLSLENKYLILEVEDPNFGDNTNERKERIEFYREIGAKQLQGVSYILPPLQGGSETQMILMISHSFPFKIIEGNRVWDLIVKIYSGLYKISETSPLLDRIRKTLSEHIEIL
ncbi:MAG: hypothetical protein HQL91_11305 [Magnetococcales bacterium]|nr:hypothetical protein [Magnetococcales bacterium]